MSKNGERENKPEGVNCEGPDAYAADRTASGGGGSEVKSLCLFC